MKQALAKRSPRPESSQRIQSSLVRLGRGGREREEESASLADGAFGPDAAAVLLDNAAAEREAQAGAAQGARVRRVALLEALEDVSSFSGAMPRP